MDMAWLNEGSVCSNDTQSVGVKPWATFDLYHPILPRCCRLPLSMQMSNSRILRGIRDCAAGRRTCQCDLDGQPKPQEKWAAAARIDRA